MSQNLKEIIEGKTYTRNMTPAEIVVFSAGVSCAMKEINERIKELEDDRTNELQIKVHGYDEWSHSIDYKISELNRLLGK